MAKSELCEGLWLTDLFGGGYDNKKTTSRCEAEH